MKLDAKQLRITKPTENELSEIIHSSICLILDNVLDTYNIGSLFRLADAVAAKELILCGASETPPLSRIHKAAIGTEEWVKWRYFKTAKEAMLQLRQEIPGTRFMAVEQDTRAMSISELNIIPDDDVPVAIILGHETNGVSKEALDFADIIVEIPMLGINKSLNVHVSAAIAVYKVLNIT